MRIGFFMPPRSIWDGKIEALSREFPGHEFLAGLRPGDAAASGLDLMAASFLPREAYLASPGLKAVFQPMTGVDHLPLAELAARGVKVYNVHANAPDVAERALAMTLAFYGRIVDYHNALKAGLWHGPWVKGGSEDRWDSLRGRTCLVLGTGAIGTEIAKLLKAFSCRVLGFRRRTGLPAPGGFDGIVESLEAGIAAAEIVFLALPATESTRGIVSKDILASMRGRFLVNVGRGSLVDEEGLYLALRDGVLRGAALDAWYQYPTEGKAGEPSRFPIRELPNVILSPHVAGSTNQAAAEAVEATAANIAAFLRTGTCGSEVDPAAAY